MPSPDSFCRRPYGKKSASKPAVLIIGVQEDRMRSRRGVRECAKRTLVTARTNGDFTKKKANSKTRDPRSPARYTGSLFGIAEILKYSSTKGRLDGAAYTLDRHLTYRTACAAAVSPCNAVAYLLQATTLPISYSVGYWLLLLDKTTILNTTLRWRWHYQTCYNSTTAGIKLDYTHFLDSLR